MCKPKIRFKGCQGEWVREKLGEISEKTQNINWKEANRTYKYIDLTSVDLQFHNIGQTITIEADNAPSRAQQIVLKGDIIFATTRPTQMRVCRIDEEYDSQICSTGYCVIRPKGGLILSEWLIQVLSTDSFKNYLELNQTTGNYPSISNKLLLEFAVPIPTLPEQRQIAAYFRSLDGILSGCEARLSSLRRLKEGALQAFFPQQGETQPKIRFKGCQGEWERKKLGEVCEMRRGTAITKKDVVKGDIPVVAGGQAPAYYCKNANRTGDIITVAGSGAYAGFVQYWDSPIFVSDAFSVKGSSELLTKFVYYILSNLQSKIYQTKKGSGVPHVHISAIENFLIPIPSLPEQHLIANFFRTLDRRIELERQRLEKLKQLKAACLEKMFV